ncbi:hypothetical protein EPIB1_1835 [Tritonibacter mobilis]|nr:hypothetical protein EPIB1_1835 [Tritonibacter mobilis]
MQRSLWLHHKKRWAWRGRAEGAAPPPRDAQSAAQNLNGAIGSC